ncbi:MAG: YjbQ family protein [Gammaproteobacteria bacterium]|nr:YjbQ family protein [Gammaproteobacteria bacterium]
MVVQKSFTVATPGRGTVDITRTVQTMVRDSGIRTGICHVFMHHTSASLILCENADPDVHVDLETFMADLVPDGRAGFIHTAEGPDDMTAHVRSVLTTNDLTLPVTDGRCALGTWQGIYAWEHRTTEHKREISITLYGEM